MGGGGATENGVQSRRLRRSSGRSSSTRKPWPQQGSQLRIWLGKRGGGGGPSWGPGSQGPRPRPMGVGEWSIPIMVQGQYEVIKNNAGGSEGIGKSVLKTGRRERHPFGWEGGMPTSRAAPRSWRPEGRRRHT